MRIFVLIMQIIVSRHFLLPHIFHWIYYIEATIEGLCLTTYIISVSR